MGGWAKFLLPGGPASPLYPPPPPKKTTLTQLWEMCGATLTQCTFICSFTADIISTVEFNHDGELLATGDKGGRVVIFQREEQVSE